MTRRRLTKREQARRGWMRDRATARFYALENGRRSFGEIWQRILKRWPVSAAEPGFKTKLQRLFDREAAQRRAWYEEQARRWFGLRDPRWDFERLTVYIRNRRPALAKNPFFAAELRRLFDENSGAG